jgi:hypothetical protein
MGAVCCVLCFNKSFHGLEMADNISSHLTSMIRKIQWGHGLFDNLNIKLNTEIKQNIAAKIVKHIKKNNIKVTNLNGFITDYIALNIAGLIFHKFIWDIIYEPILNEVLIKESDINTYPIYEQINMEYKDIFTNKAIENYTNKFEEKKYFKKFVIEFRKSRNLEEYNIEYQLGKEVISKHLESYLTLVINQIINNNNIDSFNYSDYMNTMITKKNIYESTVENSFHKVCP